MCICFHKILCKWLSSCIPWAVSREGGLFGLYVTYQNRNLGSFAVFIAKLASPPRKPPPCIFFYFGYFYCENGWFFAMFRLYRVHLGDLSTYFIEFLLLVEDDLRLVRGCFLFAVSRLHNKFSVFWWREFFCTTLLIFVTAPLTGPEKRASKIGINL